MGSLSSTQFGLSLALCTAVCWAISPFFIASAGRRVGSFPVLLLRSALATALLVASLPLYALLLRVYPAWPSWRPALWMAISGLLGTGIGDAFNYEAHVTLGPRRTTQALTVYPVIAVILAWVLLDETLSITALTGIALVLLGTSYAVFAGQRDATREPGRVSAMGLVMALCGSLCVGFGVVAARYAFRLESMDPMVATIVRVGAATVGVWMVPLLRGRIIRTFAHARDGLMMSRLIPGVLLGPFIGMICFVASLKYAPAGLASTFASTAPLFVLPIVALRYHTRVTWQVGLATLIAVAGVAMVYLR